ncbi:putative UDP-glucuronosyl/UDP-glucosyltransferase [Helianthus annuus]|uniref:UDP-glucuronosyl/UDP-glucosyltransferase n=1 Tax=Helianthus annuus TaxID=4232 RepID=A0A9K3JMG5_HELAN|nr:putative UDP-glucuronosyl/UDP-glucosyltransferase [Helianthus annuus]
MMIDWVPRMKGIKLRDQPRNILATKHDDPRLYLFMGVARMADKVSHMLRSIFPHIYSVGPIQLQLNQITQAETKNSSLDTYSLWKEEYECVQWLHEKEPDFVVYVSFGSETVISTQELSEFGWGLIDSNHYFVWIIQTDLVDGKTTVLPQELEEVLNHHSVGGFLTHGGWGSVIESLSAGVPMVCWPGTNDQRVNCIQICKEWEVGMEFGNVVKRDEVEKLVRELMGGGGLKGDKMRKKALEWKKMAAMATGPNESSSLDQGRTHPKPRVGGRTP